MAAPVDDPQPTLVQISDDNNDIAIRIDDVDSGVWRPRGGLVHLLPVDRRFFCWRCDAITVHSTDPPDQAIAA